MNLQTQCDFLNKAQIQTQISLLNDHWLAMTYGSHLRIGTKEGGEILTTWNGIAEDSIVSMEPGGKVQVTLYHGRNTVDEQLDDWGFGAETTEGFVEHPTADAVRLTTAGLWLLDFSGKKAKARLIPFVAKDLLQWGGKFYGDVSIQAPE
jgi:hypothetical protein